ncbi:glycosyltransferase [Halomonas sp. JS92-SW72]|uniref:glycosyltransferase family 32 protein n=1 Tax=Halomonas sp. JS92-SW72 TaxID=2306583 RepID=UPI000E5B09EE|nr:glycosyltransferase [Halomonas sp. JS92-SW72]AXY43651.1 glycosyl transferase [Halomonas sp. JS92-SW72]
MKQTLIVATSRLIKLVANITKVISYPFHWVLPKMRFTLPEQAAPLLKDGKVGPIPRIIWQTNFTNRVTLPVYLNYLFNRLMAPRFEYRFMITEARRKFIGEYYPEILPHYERLQIGAAQADFWRLLVLHKHGGVYLDIDAHQIWPLSRVLGDHQELYVTTRKGELSNYFIASAPGNPNLARLIERVVENIQENNKSNVFEITGPGVFIEALNLNNIPTVSYRHAVHQGSFTNEHFQYIDKPEGKWTRQQVSTRVLSDAENPKQT